MWSPPTTTLVCLYFIFWRAIRLIPCFWCSRFIQKQTFHNRDISSCTVIRYQNFKPKRQHEAGSAGLAPIHSSYSRNGVFPRFHADGSVCTDRRLNCALDHQSVMAAKALYTTLHTTITSLHNQILRCCRQASRNEKMAPGTGE